MGQERLDSVSTLYWRRHALLSWLWWRDQKFCISKVKEKDFLNCVLHCNCKYMQQGCKQDLSLWISKQYRRPAFKMMYVQFCNEAKSCAYWLVNETLWYETETFDFQSEARSRPRPSDISTRPRRLETTSRDRLETELSRPRLHPWPIVLVTAVYKCLNGCVGWLLHWWRVISV